MVPATVPCACPALRLEALSLSASAPDDGHAPAPQSFLREVLWPEFEALNEALVGYLAEVTARIVRDEVHGETGDAEERAEPRGGLIPAPGAPLPLEKLAGLVERVTFHNPDNGFCVLRVKARGSATW